MERSSEYIGLFLTFLASLGVALLMVGIHAWLGRPRPNPEKSEPFECGLRPFQEPQGNFSIKFYLIAMLFILFDVEIVWFFPWAVILRDYRWMAFWVMAFFLFFLIIGFVYAWRKGALEWER